jgi:5-methylcytosine-specific restriction protein A
VPGPGLPGRPPGGTWSSGLGSSYPIGCEPHRKGFNRAGAGFNFNSRQARLHSAIEPGETLWLFTVVRNPPRFYLAAKLTIRSKTLNRPGYKYGDYRVWGDLNSSKYFRVRPDVPADEGFDLLRHLPLTSGSLSTFSRSTLPQGCQTIRGVTEEGQRLLSEFSNRLELETRAIQVADEYELERGLVAGDTDLAEVLARDHRGPSDERRNLLLASASRDRKLVKDLYQLYAGRCQLCAFDSPVVYGTASAEAHHIVYLSRGGDDLLDNMALLCPNHHTVIHSTDATFDYGGLRFCFPNGRVEPLCLNTHLRSHSLLERTSAGCSDGLDVP